MAQSYTRQSTFSDGDTITASLFNNEYNQLLNSFSYSASNASTTGHRHDGTAAQGGNIFKIGDLDFLNKIEVDSTNNRWGFYVEVSSATVEQIRVQDGAIVPVTDNDIDLGTSSLQFKDIYINGTANLDSLTLSSGSTVTVILDEDDLSTNSATALATQQSIKAYVDAQVTAQDFDFSADSGGALSIDLDSEAMTFTGGTGIDTSGSGNAVTFAIDSTVATLTGTQTFTNKTLTSPDINGGTVDGATIATSDITVGSGKTLDVSAGTLTLADNQISGNKVEGGTIAATTITDLTFGSLDDGTINITAFVDEDNMASDSATLVPTQQSVKAYVDSQVTAQDLDVTTDSGTIAIDLDSETLTVSGGTGLDSSATGNAITVAIDSTVATLTGSQTLTNKTLTAPVISGNLTTDGLLDGRDVAADGTKLDTIESNATADQTDAEIKTAYENNSDTNAFTDAEKTKLSGIEASADVTDTANVTAAGALMDSELTAIASVKALNQGVATSDSPTFTNLTLSGTGSVKVPVGTTAQRDGSPAAGMFRYNSSLEQFEGYTSEWGSIGGGGGTNTFTTDSFTGNGSTTAYALSQVTSSEDNLLVFIEGVFQQQDAYSIATASGITTLTFSAAPANGNAILIYSVASAVSGSNLNIDSMTGDGADTTLTLSIAPVNENNTQVFIDGVYQSKANYSISGTTLTFSTAPPTGTAVEVMTFTQTDINVPVDGTITPAKIASGDFYFDTNTLYVDATNNRVGISTSSPVSALDLSGGADGTIGVLTLAQGNGTSKVAKVYGTSANTNEKGIRLNTYHYADIDAVTITSDGKVGIGTNSTYNMRTTIAGTGSALSTGTGSYAVASIYDTATAAAGTGGGLAFQGDDGTNSAVTFATVNGSKENATAGNYASYLGFSTRANGGNLTEKVRIDSAGKVNIGGVGNISPYGIRFAINGTGSGGAGLYFGGGVIIPTDNTPTITDANVDLGASNYRFKDLHLSGKAYMTGLEPGAVTITSSSYFIGNTAAGYRFNNAADNANLMILKDNGDLMVGTTAAYFARFTVQGEASQNAVTVRVGTNGYPAINFQNTSGAQQGYITTNASSVQYVSISDQRAKENIADADDAGSKIDSIQVRKFDWIVDGSHQDYGMIAQELQAVAPEAVSGDADSENMMGVDYSKLVPMLVKEIQSLRTRVQELENN